MNKFINCIASLALMSAISSCSSELKVDGEWKADEVTFSGSVYRQNPNSAVFTNGKKIAMSEVLKLNADSTYTSTVVDNGVTMVAKGTYRVADNLLLLNQTDCVAIQDGKESESIQYKTHIIGYEIGSVSEHELELSCQEGQQDLFTKVVYKK